FSSTTAVAGITVSGAPATIDLGTLGDTGTITMSGGQVTIDFPFIFAVNQGVQFQGDYTVDGASGALAFNHTKGTAYVGTATVKGAQLWYAHDTQVSTDSHIIIDGGGLVIRQGGTLTFGSLEMNSGLITLGRNNSDIPANAITSSFSGTGG